jgi:hypothetical protein
LSVAENVTECVASLHDAAPVAVQVTAVDTSFLRTVAVHDLPLAGADAKVIVKLDRVPAAGITLSTDASVVENPTPTGM